MTHASEMSADRRSALFFTMIHVGAAATVLLLATLVLDLPDFVDGFPQGLLLVCIGVILRRRLRDEYVEELWQSGTAAAFVAIAGAFLLGPIVVGLARLVSGSGPDPRSFSVLVQWPAAVALAGFFAGFYWRMLAGANRS